MNALGGLLAFVYAPVHVPGGGVRFEVLAAEPTDVPGLVIVPDLTEDGAGFTGAWRVAHHGTGRPVSPPYGSPDEALRAACRLASVTGARWDRTPYARPGAEAAVAEEARLLLEPTLALVAG